MRPSALSKALYDRLGVRLVKQYTPMAGDIVNRRYGLTIADIHPTLDSHAGLADPV